jgi:hypothetical protein
MQTTHPRNPRKSRKTSCNLNAQLFATVLYLLRPAQFTVLYQDDRQESIYLKPLSRPSCCPLICQSAPLIKRVQDRTRRTANCSRGKTTLGPEHPSRCFLSYSRRHRYPPPRRSRRPAESIFPSTTTLPRSSSTTSRLLCFLSVSVSQASQSMSMSS